MIEAAQMLHCSHTDTHSPPLVLMGSGENTARLLVARGWAVQCGGGGSAAAAAAAAAEETDRPTCLPATPEAMTAKASSAVHWKQSTERITPTPAICVQRTDGQPEARSQQAESTRRRTAVAAAAGRAAILSAGARRGGARALRRARG